MTSPLKPDSLENLTVLRWLTRRGLLAVPTKDGEVNAICPKCGTLLVQQNKENDKEVRQVPTY
jgi:hypothetical protein